MSWNTPTAQCAGKIAWATKAGAIAHRQRLVRRSRGRHNSHKDKGRGASALQPYRCETCHQWHLGNRSQGKPVK
jgi:hypothetical protein